MEILVALLAQLRAAHWSHWTSHWQTRGDPFYGDHQMFSKMYEGIEDEIDTLAEKLVGEFGPAAVDPVAQAHLMANMLEAHASDDPVQRALSVEEGLQDTFKHVYSELKDTGALSLGMDDFIMGAANTHDSFLYLLRQRTRLHKTAALLRRVADSTVQQPRSQGVQEDELVSRGRLLALRHVVRQQHDQRR